MPYPARRLPLAVACTVLLGCSSSGSGEGAGVGGAGGGASGSGGSAGGFTGGTAGTASGGSAGAGAAAGSAGTTGLSETWKQNPNWSEANCPAPPSGVNVGPKIGDYLANLSVKSCEDEDIPLDRFCGARGQWIFVAHGW